MITDLEHCMVFGCKIITFLHNISGFSTGNTCLLSTYEITKKNRIVICVSSICVPKIKGVNVAGFLNYLVFKPLKLVMVMPLVLSLEIPWEVD